MVRSGTIWRKGCLVWAFTLSSQATILGSHDKTHECQNPDKIAFLVYNRQVGARHFPHSDLTQSGLGVV